MLKDIYFGVQGALLILSGCAASDFCYRGILPGIYAAVIIIACVMSLYSSVMCYQRTGKKRTKEVRPIWDEEKENHEITVSM